MLEIREIKNRSQWKEFADTHKHAYYSQSWEYGDFKENYSGLKVYRLGLFDGDQQVGAAQVVDWIDRAGKSAYCIRGPLLDWTNTALVEEALKALTEYFRPLGYLLFRSDPAIRLDNQGMRNLYKGLGFKSAVKTQMVADPWFIDIDGRGDEELLDWMREHGMRQKVPNYIRGAVRKGVEIKIVEKFEELDQFTDMIGSHGERKGVSFGSADNFKNWWKYMDGSLKIFIAYFKGKPVVSAVIMMYGNEASYLYGASTPEVGNSNASYLLQWEAIKHARALGLKRYNFWGVIKGDAYNPKHKAYGYSYFKRSFGGYLEELINPWEYPYKKINYQLFRLEEMLRLHKLKKLGFQ